MSPFFKFQKCVKASRQPKEKSVNLNPSSKSRLFIKVLVVVFLVGSIFLYLLQINSLATKGFKIQELEGQTNDLKNANKKLSIETIRLRSMSELNEKVQNLDMVPISQFSYIEATSTGVAKR